MSSNDPYRTSNAGYAVQQVGRGVEYGRILTYIFESPNWLMNVVWSALCAMLSGLVVGQLVMYGYQADILISSLQNRDAVYPDFDSNKIGDYLLRGLWVWLGIIIASMLLGFLLFFCLVALILFMALLQLITSDGNSVPVFIQVGMITGYLVIIGGGVITSFLMVTPVAIKLCLSGNLAELFDWKWHIDFIKRTLGSMILASLMLIFSGMLLSFVGLLACFIGIFPATGWLMMSQAQMYCQLYRTYLERGGTAVNVQLIGSNI